MRRSSSTYNSLARMGPMGLGRASAPSWALVSINTSPPEGEAALHRGLREKGSLFCDLRDVGGGKSLLWGLSGETAVLERWVRGDHEKGTPPPHTQFGKTRPWVLRYRPHLPLWAQPAPARSSPGCSGAGRGIRRRVEAKPVCSPWFPSQPPPNQPWITFQDVCV